MNIELDEYVELLLKVDGSFETKFSRVSAIKSLLKGAREFSGRNLQTGFYEQKDLNEYDCINELVETKRFNGLISYLILLEIIGSIFQSKDTICNHKGIDRALVLFSEKIKGDSIFAISSLRHTLVHRFSLCTKDKGDKSFKFTLNWCKNEKIIKIPILRWDGNFANSDEETYTEIYVENLIDEIEFIYLQCIPQLKNNLIEIVVTIDELKSRYSIK
jgi:hypothetical protein